MQNMKILLNNIIELYCGKNYTLATLAATALVNMTHNNRENKLNLYQRRN